MLFLKIQEKGYQTLRLIMSQCNAMINQDYEPVVHSGQWLLTKLKIPSLYTNYSQYLSRLNINTEVFSLQYESPITFAAFESHLDSIRFWLYLGCGGGCLKTIKFEKSPGNLTPRIQQLKINGQEHLINALGLPGPGIKALLSNLKHSPLIHMHHPIGISIGGHTLKEYKQVVDVLAVRQEALFKQTYFELNISCPNTTTGKSLHDNLFELEQLLKYIRLKLNGVIVIKVSPDAKDQNLLEIAELATSYDQVTINAGNTQFKEETKVGLKSGSISIGGGGLSGPLLFERTLEMAKLLSPFKLPLIATGGIATVDQIKALQPHGVVCVGLATGLVKNPFIIPQLNQRLADG
ncbi:MAG: hypothetical protein VW397_01005 [Candidatus Margulisiibacteriota bacterium]